MPSHKSIEKNKVLCRLLIDRYRKEYRYYAIQTNRSKLVYIKENRDYAVQTNRSTYNKLKRKKETKTSLPTVPG